MDKQTADAMRGLNRRVTFKNVKDNGQTQTASVEVADGIWRDDVEIFQPYGFASHVPADGGLAIAFAIGGDQGDIAIMPIGNPSKRLGNLKEHECGMYNGHGDTAILTAGGSLDIKTGAQVTVTTAAGVFVKATVLAMDGDITCTGDISDKNGSMQEMRDKYNVHGHPDSPDPEPQMT